MMTCHHILTVIELFLFVLLEKHSELNKIVISYHHQKINGNYIYSIRIHYLLSGFFLILAIREETRDETLLIEKRKLLIISLLHTFWYLLVI